MITIRMNEFDNASLSQLKAIKLCMESYLSGMNDAIALIHDTLAEYQSKTMLIMNNKIDECEKRIEEQESKNE